MSDYVMVPRALLCQVYGMAREGCESPTAGYRWCERIDELFHAGEGSDEYAAYARALPDAMTAPTPQEAAPVRVNQCDGCRSGAMLDDDGMHRAPSGHPIMLCQRARYEPIPADESGQGRECVVCEGEFSESCSNCSPSGEPDAHPPEPPACGDAELLEDVAEALANYSLSQKSSDPVGHRLTMDLRERFRAYRNATATVAEDAARMDWLEDNGCDLIFKHGYSVDPNERWYDADNRNPIGKDRFPSLRALIDAARLARGDK